MSRGTKRVGDLLYCDTRSDVVNAWHVVLKHCALEKDMELFEAGDMTEVGERGLTLRYVDHCSSDLFDSHAYVCRFSGGQKVLLRVKIDQWMLMLT